MSLKDEWGTPPALFELLQAEFALNLDVCATAENALLPAYFSGPCGQEPGGYCLCGLCQPWTRARAYMNPPYSAPATWAMKAAAEAQERAQLVVALLPAATGEQWFHANVFEKAHEVRFLRGRVQYVAPEGLKASSNRFGSVVAIYRAGAPPLRGAVCYPWDWKRGGG